MRWSAAQSLSWIIKQKPLPLREWTSDMGPKLKDARGRSLPASLLMVGCKHGAENSRTDWLEDTERPLSH